ncbi:glycosyl transferase, group 1 family protein [Verrucomicrobiia bacterium DG1235]|nr:glycosyl transferase, group 1 family protein [Verrucomicrobiae bacterium DG1235]
MRKRNVELMSVDTTRLKSICVLWQSVGPYHLARLEAAYLYLKEFGIELICLETAGSKGSLVKEAKKVETPYRRIQLFPDRVFEDISPTEMDRAVQDSLDELNPDAVATNSYFLPDTRSALRWCRRNARAAVTMVDSKEDDAPRVRWREFLKSIIVRQYNAALVAGKPHRAYLQKLGLKPECIYDGLDVVDNDFFADAAERARANPGSFSHLPGLFDDEPYFLVSSRFIPRKNFDRLLSAYGNYRRESDRPWRLVILGDGRLRPELEGQIERDEIGGVTFAGLRPLDEVSAYYAFAGALVHPAIVDQWALVVNEAMATGLPVIVSTGSGCYQDLVHPGKNGFHFDPSDVEGLTAALSQMASDETDRIKMGEESRRIVGEWPPARFARGLHDAAKFGVRSRERGLGPAPRFVLWLMLKMSKAPASFASVEA